MANMAEDPNNTKWARKEDRVGLSIMKRTGWREGKGLGQNEEGEVANVKTHRKDDTLGIGYSSKVQQTWSQQSVNFADILTRISKSSPTAQEAPSFPGGEEQEVKVTAAPAAGKHASAYEKRRRLKTEGLSNEEGKAEVLGSAAVKHATAEEVVEVPSTLKSPILTKMMVRVCKYEPRPSGQACVEVVKPDPRPSQCTATPFLA